MMLYLTGAPNSLAKSSEAPQTDAGKSLGGYISSSIVPNGNINSLFDMISLSTLKNKPKETIAIALVNKFENAVSNVEIKIVTKSDAVGKFKIAAVNVSEDYLMEHIDNRYSEPIQAEFHDVDFYRARVVAKIVNHAISGEIISFQPFDVTVEIEKPDLEETMNAIINAFSLSSDYVANKLSDREFEIVSRADNVVTEHLECFAVSTENAEIVFDGKFENEKDNTALIAETLEPNQAIGIWIQRQIVPEIVSNEELLRRYNDGVVTEETEEIEMVLNYDLVETHDNNHEPEDDNGG